MSRFFIQQGGIKAVVWTDTIQIILIYGSITMLLIKGVSDVGGLGIVWDRNYNSSRIELFKYNTSQMFQII
jgi:Na+/proline symporter